MENWTYASLLFFSLIIPFIRSFESRIRFVSKWPALFAGILAMMLIFIPWDIWFTRSDIWHFNHEYVTGIYIASLPIEEWLFFIVISYACIFTYEVLKYFLPKFHVPQISKYLSIFAGLMLIVIGLSNSDKLYTLIVTLLGAVLLSIQLLTTAHKTWLSHFWLSYFVTLIPFFIVNGILTDFPVVIYNNSENLALRAYSIPVEDFVYFLCMMLIVTPVYEKLKKQSHKITFAN